MIKLDKECVHVVGVDEVGRGPLAGPVVAAAVVLNQDRPIAGLTDSKKLSDKKRRFLADEIRQHALAYAIAEASVQEIDQLNIHHATLLAMQRAVLALDAPFLISLVQVDGLYCPKLPYSCEAIVKGDASVAVIGAASILAKVHRDDLMIHMDQIYPGYGLAAHKGYGTEMHRKALFDLGIQDIHRRSFEPVKTLFQQGM